MEQTLQPTTTEQFPGDGNPLFNDNVYAPTVTVRHGVLHERTHPDQTVGEVRQRLRTRLGLRDESQAFLDGQPVDDQTQVRANQTLTFLRHGGEKGAVARALIADGEYDFDAHVMVQFGVFCLNVRTAHGTTVGELRRRFRRDLQIPDAALPYIDGQPADEDSPIQPGHRLTFLRGAAEIG